MTIWTQFLPGVRETRVPLAVGSLWVVVAALLFPYLPPSLRHGQLVESVTEVIKSAPVTVVVSAALFAAYLLGIVLTEVGQLAVKIVNGLARLIPVVMSFLVVLLLVLGYFPQLFVFSAVVAFGAWLKWRRFDDVPYGEYLSQTMTRGYVTVLRWYEEGWNGLKMAWDPSRQQVDFMLREESNRALATSAELRQRITSQLPNRRLGEIVRRVGLQETEFQKALAVVAPELAPLTLSKAMRRAGVEAALVPVLRAAISDRIAGNAEARRLFILAAISTGRMQADVKNRVDRAHVQLRAQYEGIYNEYDRLRAEGEFRTAIACPLAALLCAVSYLLIDDLGLKGGGETFFYVGSIAAALAMLIAGSGKKSEASALLYSSIRQQLVKNADTREYGFEYFPLKHAGVDIDLNVLTPSAAVRRDVIRLTRKVPFLHRVVRKLFKR